MEDVGTILMDVDAFDILAIDIAAQVWALVYDEAFFALLLGLVGEGCTEEAWADNEVIVVFHILIAHTDYTDHTDFFSSSIYSETILRR